MRALLSVVILLAACATQPSPAPAPVWRTVEQCDPTLLRVNGLDLARGTTSGDVKPPRIVKKVSPVVPPFSGTQFVEVDSIIDETGHVTSICQVSGEPQFVESVVRAMRQWVFEPGTLNGKPVKVLFSLTTRFHN